MPHAPPDSRLSSLPIEPALPALLDALAARGVAVLQAPPGAGKTTRVPLALLDAPWLAGRKVVMLEPRRLAARAAARRMAQTLGEPVGETVGYRVRLDTRVSARTRIEVVTEGILTRQLQHDPALEDVGAVLFDEFHERSLNADLGLALALQSRALVRDDLRLVVMSATLDGAPVARLLGDAHAGDAPVVTSEGRAWPVETRWRPRRDDALGWPERVEAHAARVTREALQQEPGDVLVFLPGAGEILRTQRLLVDGGLPDGTYVVPLFGMLAPEEQDRAIAPSRAGERKVVLATSIAQTSLTIEGVRVVVDAGLSRVPRFSVRSGMTRLETVRVSRASADQRRGRAGRTQPGTCYRLWDEGDEASLPARDLPEILEADLAPLALELACAGVTDARELAWLDAPPAAALAQARETLRALGAVDAEGRATAHGREMATFGAHPRLAHLMLRGHAMGHGAVACALAALLADRDVLRGEGRPADADIRLRLELLRPDADRGPGAGARLPGNVDREGVRRARELARDWRARLGAPATPFDAEACGQLLALAYPDRVGQRRQAARGRYLLRNGAGVALAEGASLGDAAWIVAAELDGAKPEARVTLAAPVTLDEILADFAADVVEEEVVEWQDGAVRAVRRERLGAIVQREVPLRAPDPALVARAVAAAIAREGLGVLPWGDAARALRERVAFLRTLDASWPDWSDDALAARVDEWLAPHLAGVRSRDALARLDLHGILMDALSWPQRAQLDQLAPTHVEVPTGSRIRVDYSDPASPVLAVRLQELFGLAEGPRVGGGRVPLTLHLLSPAHRPVQVTRDLAGFWRTSYFDVRKDLRGRYPKHSWPDDPMAAEPTRRAKRRGE